MTRLYLICVLDNYRSRKLILRTIRKINKSVERFLLGSGFSVRYYNTSELSIQIPFMSVVECPFLQVLTAKYMLDKLSNSLLTDNWSALWLLSINNLRN